MNTTLDMLDIVLRKNVTDFVSPSSSSSSIVVGPTSSGGEASEYDQLLNQGIEEEPVDYKNLEEFRYYSEGIVLTPISMFGIFGKIESHLFSSC